MLELGLEVPKGFWLPLQEMVLLISGSEARIFGSTLLGLGFLGFRFKTYVKHVQPIFAPSIPDAGAKVGSFVGH